jgi:molecular chaperone GrpE
MTPIMDNGNVDREEILRRFETLLDTALAGETAPAGIDAEILEVVLNNSDSTPPGTDAYALWSAMTALTQEIKLQGRAFQELNRTLVAQTEKTAEELRAVYAERERTVRRDAERRCRRELLGALIDLRDRLARGRESAGTKEREMAAAKSAGWFARTFFGKGSGKGSGNGSGKRVGADKEALEALIRGYELGIERLDQTLGECQAKEIRCAGEAFDPRRMNAIDSEESAAVAPDTVLEVYRSGYEWEGEVFRPAQVKVSRPPKHE